MDDIIYGYIEEIEASLKGLEKSFKKKKKKKIMAILEKQWTDCSTVEGDDIDE